MNGELWIWTELLAFDNTQPDFGVKEYLDTVQRIPYGISILSGIDFILYHENLEKEKVMPPLVCSRRGHLSNGIRNRQEWTNFQIRSLVNELHKYDIKVLICVFTGSMQNELGREFVYDNCPENRYAFIGKLNDGRSAGEYFVEHLGGVLTDYGFDGWHAADNIAAGWSTVVFPTDQVIQDFARSHKELELPGFLLKDASTPETDSERRAKLVYLQKFHWHEWHAHLNSAWNNFWKLVIDKVHSLNKVVMANSPNTKSIFGAMQYMNVDYRYLAEIGLDYLLVESTSPACEIIWRTRRFVHEFDAVISEMTAAMPNVKIVIMPSVKDIVETYDALEHAPCLYERDLHLQTAQHILRSGKLERCADGLIVCLGDCIEYHQWTMLHEMYDAAFSYQAAKTGEMVWLHDNEMFDALREEHHLFGTWSPSMQIKEIRNRRSVDISTIADVSELEHITQPVIAFDFDLWSEEKKAKVLASGLPMILTGNFKEEEIPSGAEAIRWAPDYPKYDWYCVFLNWKNLNPGIRDIPVGPILKPFDDTQSFALFREFYPQLQVPAEFWDKVADRTREILGDMPLKNEADGLQMLQQYGVDGSRLVHLISWQHYYTSPVFEIPEEDVSVTRLSRFPKIPLSRRDGLLSIADPVRRTPLHLTPMGLLSVEISKNK